MSRFLWTQMDDVGPTARLRHAMCFESSNNRTILFGGDSGHNGLLGDTWMREGDAWTQIGDTGPSSRHSHAMCGCGTSFLFGGRGRDAYFGDTWRILSGDDWTQLEDTGPSARAGHGMVFEQHGARVILFGGENADGPLGDTWQWDFMREDKWTQIEDTGPSARRYPVMAYDMINRRVVLFGGVDGSGRSLGDTWALTAAGWAQIAHFGVPSSAAGAMVGTDVNLVSYGGLVGSDDLLSGTWSFDGQFWTQRQDMGPGARWGHAMSFDAKRRSIVLFGGAKAAPGAAGDQLATGDTWEHVISDPATTPISGSSDKESVPTAAFVNVIPNSVRLGQPMQITVGFDKVTPDPVTVNLAWMTKAAFHAANQSGVSPTAGDVHHLPDIEAFPWAIEASTVVTNPLNAPGFFYVIAATSNKVVVSVEVESLLF
ncbi:hypothetical protein GCM10027034_17740 [Ramlibacter solisilvae]|uniref:Galactose oxidase-like Early set domain-containing protein n=2 Tax=Ramlibacter tataouinensis TaxID=94132 RepID=A0A127JVQ7_9BURK|nr:hypothetical protein UC35_16030 [Ramlibacter tataouinensis]